MDQVLTGRASVGHDGGGRRSAAAPGGLDDGSRGGLLMGAATLWQREMVRFFRQRNRVIGALATPVVFWLVLGSGLDRAFVGPAGGGDGQAGYLAYLFPGALVMILLFTAIFSTITVIEDRQTGFLQGVLVAPVSRLAIVLGKVMGGATIATVQGLVFAALWPMVGQGPGWLALGGLVAAMFVVAMGLTAMGLCFSWPMDSTAGFHAVMNLLLMPMWFLSGAVFPASTAPPWLAAVMFVNPLTYGHALVTGLLHGSSQVLVPAVVTCGFTLVMIGGAAWTAARPQRA